MITGQLVILSIVPVSRAKMVFKMITETLSIEITFEVSYLLVTKSSQVTLID